MVARNFQRKIENICRIIACVHVTHLNEYLLLCVLVSEMTYYVSSGTLNSSNSTQLSYADLSVYLNLSTSEA